MIDSENVVQGLETIKQFFGYGLPSTAEMFDSYYCILNDAISMLKAQEAKWVEDKQDEHCRLIKCSKCGLTFIVGNNIPYDEWIEDRNYCRRCGARMVKPNG